jgi:23S rRNA pseudouridine955/2504/2580 synthase
MFLHARLLAFDHPAGGARVTLESPLPEPCVRLCETLAAAA